MPPIIAIGGPVGAGNSSLAALLAQEIGQLLLVSGKRDTTVRLLRSDVFRKQFLGVDLRAKLPPKYHESGLYSRTVYTTLHGVAESVRSIGDIALIDATYTRGWQRTGLAQLAINDGIAGFWLDVPIDGRIRRLDDRHTDVSDARADFALKQQIERPTNETEWECIGADQLSIGELAIALLSRLKCRIL